MKSFFIIFISLFCFSSINTLSQVETYKATNQSYNPYVKLVGYAPCGCPIYARWMIVGYDHYKRPIWAWKIQPIFHRCKR